MYSSLGCVLRECSFCDSFPFRVHSLLRCVKCCSVLPRVRRCFDLCSPRRSRRGSLWYRPPCLRACLRTSSRLGGGFGMVRGTVDLSLTFVVFCSKFVSILSFLTSDHRGCDVMRCGSRWYSAVIRWQRRSYASAGDPCSPGARLAAALRARVRTDRAGPRDIALGHRVWLLAPAQAFFLAELFRWALLPAVTILHLRLELF